jgi:K+-sensing histidine kinase KdpD
MTLDAKSPILTVGDSDLMREALLNLTDNAIKFTPEGGKVSKMSSATVRAGADAGVSQKNGGGAPNRFRTVGNAFDGILDNSIACSRRR